MTLRLISLASFFAVLTLALLEGCNGSKPVSPSRTAALSVKVPNVGSYDTALLGAAVTNPTAVVTNEILYKVEGNGITPIRGTTGPFTTTAASGTQALDVYVPTGGLRLISLQLNDITNPVVPVPLAIGAVEIDLSGAATTTDVTVDLGSVSRNCYVTNNISYLGASYSFEADSMLNGQISTGYDTAVSAAGTGYQFVDAQGNSTGALSSIAFLGNGAFVDHDSLPPNSAYFATSSGVAKQYAIANGTAGPATTNNVEVNDIYLVDLRNISGGHAWVQVMSAGTFGIAGPSFCFRVNTSAPYYAYEQTSAAVSNACSTFY